MIIELNAKHGVLCFEPNNMCSVELISIAILIDEIFCLEFHQFLIFLN